MGRPITHGHYRRGKQSTTHKVWEGMIDRCRPGMPYALRGVSVCERWRLSFSSFLEDMGLRPDGHVIDRIDPLGNYEPSNCRWLLKRVNGQYNRRTKLFPEIRHKIDLAHAAGMSGVSIGELVGVSKQVISLYLSGKTWN